MTFTRLIGHLTPNRAWGGEPLTHHIHATLLGAGVTAVKTIVIKNLWNL